MKKEPGPPGCTLLQPHVTRVLVCDPRKNALLKVGNKNDRIDARKLSELLYRNKLSPVYHGEPGIRTLKELARSYLAMTRDLTRVISRLKAIYRSWAIPCAGKQVYAPRYRAEWLAKIAEVGVRRRAELYYQQQPRAEDLEKLFHALLLSASGGLLPLDKDLSWKSDNRKLEIHCPASALIMWRRE